MKFLGAVSIFLSATLGAVLLSFPVNADIEDLTIDTGCSQLPSYNAELELDGGTYDVYARLAKRGEQAQVQSYAQVSGNYGVCRQFGAMIASGDKWTKLGEFRVIDREVFTFQLSSQVLAGMPAANRPTVLLVPRNNPVCVPNIECGVRLDGQAGYVRPTGTLLNQNSLHVFRVVDPTKDTIKKVGYYVDSQLVYTTASLQPFDLRYVSLPGQSISRVVEYVSGQRIILPAAAPSDHADTFGHFLFRLRNMYPETFNTVAWGGGVFVSMALLLVILQSLQRRHDWRYHHGFIRTERQQSTERQLRFIEVHMKITRVLRWGIGSVAVIVSLMATIVLTDMFIIQIFTVDGHSMEKTLATGDKVIINKIPKTLAALNSREYVPDRGDVVVVRGVFGNAALSEDSTESLYLIKRVIALPGERVIIKQGIITIFNKAHPEGFNPDKESTWERSMTTGLATDNLDIQLSVSELFVSGDNRPGSIDSRFNGPLATKEVVGTMLTRIWPL